MSRADLRACLGLAARRAWAIARQALPGREVPYSSVMAALLLAAGWLPWGRTGGVDVREWASTNLVNLRSHPVLAMVGSIFVDADARVPTAAVLFIAASCVLERRAGLVRAVLIPLAGHVVATLVTEGGVRVAIWQDALPRRAAWQLDIGTSYVAFTAAAAVTAYLPTRAWRAVAVCTLLAWTARPLLTEPGDMTSWGHVICVLVGLASRHWLPGRAPAGTRAPARRASITRRGWVAVALSCLAIAGVVVIASGRLTPVAGRRAHSASSRSACMTGAAQGTAAPRAQKPRACRAASG